MIELTTATSEQKEGIRATLSLPSHRFNNLYKKILDAATAARQPEIRVAIMGDSMRRQYAEPYWYGRFGLGGRLMVPSDITDGYAATASGAATAATDNSQWISNWFDLPNAGTVTATLSALQTSQIELYYLAYNGGGTFKLQFSADGAAYADVSGGTIDTHIAGSQTLVKWTGQIESGFSKNYNIRATGLNTGTNPAGVTKLIALGAFLTGNGSRPKGVTTWDMGLGGSEPSQWVAMPQASFTTALQGFAPDVIFIRGWETLAQWQDHFPTLVSRIRTALPYVDIVVVGRSPDEVDPGLEDTPQDQYLRGYCHANNIYLIDVKRFMPTRAEMITRGWMTAPDGVHLTEAGMRACDMVIQSQLPFLWGASPVWWKLVGNVPQQNFLGGFRGSNNHEFYLQGASANWRQNIGFIAGSGNNASNLSTTANFTGIGRLRGGTDSFHDGTLGFYQGGVLAAQMRQGRLWIGTGANADRGTDKNINAGLMVQAPTTSVVTASFGAISGQTANIMNITTGAAQNADGTTVGGFTSSGRIFCTAIPTYANDAAADADAALPSGGFYKITGGRSLYQKP